MSTPRDRAILNSILNPFLPVGSDFETEDPATLSDAIGEVTNEVIEAKRIEKEAIVLAENENLLDAVKALSKAIEIAPQLPSLYNNRAQAYRLNNDTAIPPIRTHPDWKALWTRRRMSEENLRGPSLLAQNIHRTDYSESVFDALNDLNTAIMLSNERGRSACQAFCQRGLILKKNGEAEKAMEDFKRAAELGSPFAKMVLVQANPYAALCNQMLSQVMQKLIQGE